MKKELILQGKVAIVTGGYSGIGRGISEALANAGANIVIAARNYDECKISCDEISKLGVSTTPLMCDMGKTDDIFNLINLTMEKYGKIDILFNNAGITGSMKPIWDISVEEWDRTMGVNVKGMFLCSREAAKEMKKKKQGKIINVTSVAAYTALRNSGDYCASKAAAHMLTKILAIELAEYNIQVNEICPGYFSTNLNPKLIAYAERNAKKLIPAGRTGKPDDIKELAVFLASSGSDYITGADIAIDGGYLAEH